jgi:drug/metabolite transporter (DMT)-like permease
MPFTSATTARLLFLVAALMWSTGGLFAKSPVFESWDDATRGVLLAFWRALFASVILLPFVRRLSFRWAMLPMAFCFLAMNVSYMSAMVYTTGANAIWMQNTSPVWIFLVSAFVFHERVTRRDWIMFAFVIAGVVTIVICESLNELPFGVICGLLSGLFYSGVLLSLRYLRDEDAAWLVALNHIATAIVLAPVAFAIGAWPSGVQFGYLSVFGMLQMGLPYLLCAKGLRSIAGHEASGILLLEPILLPLWVWLAWSTHAEYDPPRWWTYFGGGLILVGLALRYFSFRRAPNGA